MQEIIDQLRDQLRGAWRYRWIAFSVAACVCVVGWAVVFLLPDKYRASARVYVDTRTTLSEVTNGISVETGVEAQIDRVRQQMLGAPALQKVGDETDLFRGAVTAREKQKRIEKLRKEITIKAGGGTSSNIGGTGVYIIEYENRDRDMSERVVDKLLNTFVEGTLGGRRSGSQKAQEFLVNQIEEYGKRLSEAELKVAEFKKKNFGVMPAAQGDHYTRLQEETTAVQRLEGELRTAQQQRVTLQAQLNVQQPYVSQASAGGAGLAMIPSATAQRIREAEAKLDELLVRYRDKHPEVSGLREQIADLKQRQAEELAAAKQGDSVAAANAGLSANPVYQLIQQDSNKNEVSIAGLQADLATRRNEVARLRGLMDISANVEAQFSELNRDYDVTKTKYLELLQRKEQTSLSEQAQETGMVNVEIIDPPSAGFEPVAPLRFLLIPAVLVMALGAGGGMAYLLHLLSPVFYTTRSLEVATGLQVIGVVPRTWLDMHRMALRREIFKYSGMVAILVLFAVLIIWQQTWLTDLSAGFRL